MEELKIFTYEEHPVRTVFQNGELWWVLADVCKVVELSNPSRVAERLDDDEKMTLTLSESHSGQRGGAQKVNIINESGLYKVILRSDKPEAKKFTRWVTHEVLPSIRRHGAYMTPNTIDEIISNPEFGIKLLTALKEEQDKCKALEAENQALLPKAGYFDELVDRNTLTNFRDTAKELKVKQKKFIAFLLEQKYVYRDGHGKLLPYADKNDGLFELKECFSEKSKWSGTQTLVTPRGRETFRLLCKSMERN